MIYFIETEDSKYIKIGYTKYKSIERIQSIGRAMPYNINLLLFIEGDLSKEKLLHEQFKQLWHKNEWFIYSQEIKTYIEDNKSLNDTNHQLKKKNTQYSIHQLISDYENGIQRQEIIKKYNISLSTLYKILRDNNIHRDEQKEKSLKYEYYKGQRIRKAAIKSYRKGNITQEQLNEIYKIYPTKKKKQHILDLLQLIH